jgi:hypothetical protein
MEDTSYVSRLFAERKHHMSGHSEFFQSVFLCLGYSCVILILRKPENDRRRREVVLRKASCRMRNANSGSSADDQSDAKCERSSVDDHLRRKGSANISLPESNIELSLTESPFYAVEEYTAVPRSRAVDSELAFLKLMNTTIQNSRL